MDSSSGRSGFKLPGLGNPSQPPRVHHDFEAARRAVADLDVAARIGTRHADLAGPTRWTLGKK